MGVGGVVGVDGGKRGCNCQRSYGENQKGEVRRWQELRERVSPLSRRMKWRLSVDKDLITSTTIICKFTRGSWWQFDYTQRVALEVDVAVKDRQPRTAGVRVESTCVWDWGAVPFLHTCWARSVTHTLWRRVATLKANVHVEYMHVLSGQVCGELFKANETHFLTQRRQCCSGQKNAADCVAIICCASASSSHNPPTFCSTLKRITLKWQH